MSRSGSRELAKIELMNIINSEKVNLIDQETGERVARRLKLLEDEAKDAEEPYPAAKLIEVLNEEGIVVESKQPEFTIVDDRPKAEKVLTEADKARLAAAEEKRQRKAAKLTAKNKL